MRTTVDLADDVLAAVDTLRREEGLGLSEAVNRLARSGLTRSPREPYVHRSHALGYRVDVTNVGEVLDLLDDEG